MNTETKTLLGVAAIVTGVFGAIFTERYFKDRQELQAELKKLELEVQYPDSYWEAKKHADDLLADIKRAKIEADERIRREKIAEEKRQYDRRIEFEQSAPESYWRAKEAEARANADIQIQKDRTKANIDMLVHETNLMRELNATTERALRSDRYI